MSKLENMLPIIIGALGMGVGGFFISKAIYEKPPAEVKSSAVHENVISSSTVSTDVFAPAARLPPGFWLEYDTANNSYRQCQPSTCGLFDYQTKEEAIARAWNWVRDNEREVRAKWEKVKP